MTVAETMAVDPVYDSLERVADALGDIVEPVYARYFAKNPDAAQLMAHMDTLTRGRMLEEVVRLLMTPDYTEDQGYLDFEIKNHEWAYHVEPGMYGDLLEAVRETVADGLGAEWSDAWSAAWQQRIDILSAEIARRMTRA